MTLGIAVRRGRGRRYISCVFEHLRRKSRPGRVCWPIRAALRPWVVRSARYRFGRNLSHSGRNRFFRGAAMNALKRLTLGVVLVNAGAVTCQAETQGIEVYEQTPPNKAVLVLAKRDLFTQLINSVNKDRDKIDKALTAALC